MATVLTYHIKRGGKRLVKAQTIADATRIVGDYLKSSIVIDMGKARIIHEHISVEITTKLEEERP
jgi:hypothetical protein